MALGVVTSFSEQQQIALKLAFMWLAVYTMMSSLGHIILLENDEDIDQFSTVAQFKNRFFSRKVLAVT